MNAYIATDTTRVYFPESGTYRKGLSFGATNDLEAMIKEYGVDEIESREILYPNQKAAMQRSSDVLNRMVDTVEE